MRLSLIALILLATAACAPLQAVSQATQIPPVPVAVTIDTTIPSMIASVTSMPACICPTGVVTQSQGGVISRPPVICSCPAIIVSPPVEATEVGSNPQATPMNGITLADNGKTFILHPGETFLLNLGIDVFDWTVNIDNQNVLSRVKNVMVIRGAQGIYEANSPGQAALTATGNPFCRNSVPACGAPSILFKITVIVQ